MLTHNKSNEKKAPQSRTRTAQLKFHFALTLQLSSRGILPTLHVQMRYFLTLNNIHLHSQVSYKFFCCLFPSSVLQKTKQNTTQNKSFLKFLFSLRLMKMNHDEWKIIKITFLK